MQPSTVIASEAAGALGTPVTIYRPEARGAYPVVLVLPERYGVVQHMLDIGRRIASNGYVVGVPDVMCKCPDPDALHAGTISWYPSDDDIFTMLDDVLPVVGAQPGADGARVGLIGLCQSGRYPFSYAARKPVRALVVFYGAALASEWEVTAIHPTGIDGLIARMARTNVLGIFGEGDHVVPIPEILRLRNELERHKHSYQFTIYPEVPHGFLNDTMPGRYRPKEAEAAWAELLAFLATKLAPVPDDAFVDWRFTARHALDYDFTKKVRFE